MSPAVPAYGQLWRFNVLLDGSQEVPPVPTTGTGSAVVWLDEAALTIDIFGTATGPSADNPLATQIVEV
jgi:hypothetical protein